MLSQQHYIKSSSSGQHLTNIHHLLYVLSLFHSMPNFTKSFYYNDYTYHGMKMEIKKLDVIFYNLHCMDVIFYNLHCRCSQATFSLQIVKAKAYTRSTKPKISTAKISSCLKLPLIFCIYWQKRVFEFQTL